MPKNSCLARYSYLEFSTSDVGGVGQDLDGLLEHGAEGVVGAVAAERRRLYTTNRQTQRGTPSCPLD
jgi:hypothetical protein